MCFQTSDVVSSTSVLSRRSDSSTSSLTKVRNAVFSSSLATVAR